MVDLIDRVMGFGVDFGTRGAVKSVLATLNADIDRADEVYVKIRNKLNLKKFSEVPHKDRAVFMPQCLRSSEHCKADFGKDGYTCNHCGHCDASPIVKEAEKLGYRVYIVPGGSMVFKIWARETPKAVLGIACYFELGEALEKMGHLNIPALGVPLDRDGCKDTKANVDEAIRMLRL